MRARLFFPAILLLFLSPYLIFSRSLCLQIARMGKKGKARKFDSLSLMEGAGEMKSVFKLS